MFAFGSAVVLAASLQVITAQGPPNLPPQCRGPPPGVERPFDCCKIPPFFANEDFEQCGFKKLDDGPPQRQQGPPPGPPDCSKQMCMLDKYGLSKEGNVDHEAVSAFLDKWAENNEAFKPTIVLAKERCVGKELPGPPQICEANKLVFCISSNLFSECPTWEQTDGCNLLKAHLEQCKPFFNKP